MNSIKANIPLDNEFFWLPTPAPTKNKFEAATTREIIEIQTDEYIIIAERHSYLHFPLNLLSEIICKAAGYNSREDCRQYLRHKYPYIKPDTEIAFWLFKQLEVKPNNKRLPENVGLNQL